MNLKYLSIIISTLLILSSCKKDSDKNITTSSIIAQLFINDITISKVKLDTKSSGIIEVNKIAGANNVEVDTTDEELWFSFNASAGELYEVNWQDKLVGRKL